MSSQNPNPNPNTFSTAILQQFTDPPGGADLNDPILIARPRRGRPDYSIDTPKEQKPTQERQDDDE